MSGAEDTSLSPAHWVAAPNEAAPAGAPPRRRLFRKYALLFIALVGAALLVNSGFDFWFSYQENKAGLVRIQQEKADAAATRIEEYVGEIERQIGWTTHAQWASGPLDQRRQDYFRLLRQVPGITELSELDGEGKEQLQVSRLKMDVVGSAEDFSQSPGFTQAKAHRIWFSPVYFRKESEPYMTLAMAREGRKAGVTVAEINLKLIWDVITALKIGQSGYAYVVDGRGRLIAHPDISLVLRDTDLSRLPQVAAALAPASASASPMASGPRDEAPAATLARNLAGRRVLTAHAAIAPVGWRVFVEVPLAEAFAPLYGAALRTAGLLLFGLIAATLVALVIARRMTGPIRAIADGAERIGAGQFERRIELHTGDELEALAEQFNRMGADLQKSYAELEQRVADRTAELSESLDRQTATAEVLGIISSSPGRLEPVFEAMLGNAVRICGGAFGMLVLVDGDGFRGVAAHGVGAHFTDAMSRLRNPPPGTILAQLLADPRTIQMADTAAEPAYDPVRALNPDFARVRTNLCVPMLREDELIGAICVFRDRVLPFNDKEIELVESFAKQAVIAIENVRLITEIREALDQQTATAEVLQVINSSPGDLAPVFDAMLDKALHLCEAAFGALYAYDGELMHAVAVRGASSEHAEYLKQGPHRADRGALGRVIRGEQIVHIADVTLDEGYRSGSPLARAVVELGSVRSLIAVPLRKEDALLGVIQIYRREVRPFSDKQIALLQNFAAQAVIAMENARLITETREALDQQTATAEVLGVINSSPGNLAPVFDSILEKAHTLCGAAHGSLTIYDGEHFRAVVTHGLPEPFAELLRQPYRASAGSPQERLLRGERFVHIPDTRALAPGTDDPIARASAELTATRTLLFVPLRKDDALLGHITAYREEVRPFSDKQIALLQNFAAQAVIAMENARLITETREALDQQTATAEVLGVINSSPGDLTPVFDAMLDKAMVLCEAAFGFVRSYDGEKFDLAASRGVPASLNDFLVEARVPTSVNPLGRVVHGETIIHVGDIRDEEAYRAGFPGMLALADLGGCRTALWVALRKGDALLGVFVIYRQEIRPFSDKQIALVQNFAAQAVIAIENARLITETREALEQQTATAEVLGVINSSPGDLTPIFDAILEKAHSLCGATQGALVTYDGDRYQAVATRNMPEPFAAVVREGFRPHPENPVTALIRGDRFLHVPDVAEIAAQASAANTMPRIAAELGGVRTLLAVPLRKDDALLGFIGAYRQEVRPFTDKQIALLENFAAQAVIAMENARLITETREALDQQTATAEVLQVINSSPGDLVPVFDAMLDKALRLCEAAFGTLITYDGEFFYNVAHRGVSAELAEFLHEPIKLEPSAGPQPSGSLQRLVRGETVVHDPDIRDSDAYRMGLRLRRGLVELGGARTALWVALRKDNTLLGTFVIYRREVKPFSDKQIALLQNFAAQAVIAIENARLITETREALEQQTATAEVLQVINSSPGDLAPVFDAMLERAIRLCDARIGSLWTYDGEKFSLAAVHGGSQALVDTLRDASAGGYDPMSARGRVLRGEHVTHVLDARKSEAYLAGDPVRRAMVDLGGGRALMTVSLRKDETVLGIFTIYRQEVRPFTDKQIALLQNFAAQAVIAIENARLLGELRESTDDLARSVEELKALGEVGQAVSSTLDLRAVLVTILNRSVSLTGSDAGVIFRYSRAERAFHFVEAVGYTEAMVREVRDLNVGETVTGMGEAIAGRVPLQIPDLRERPPNPLRDTAVAAGYRSVLIVPLVGADRIMGATILQRRVVGEFPEATVRLMQTLAAQSVLAIQNARLFREIADKSEQLALASEHKSQFLANMSHELRTPLNAILGYTELMVDGIYGELPPRAAGVLERVQNNGKHLLALINDVLDLAKIEAGQLVLTLEDYAMPDVVQSVVSATEGLANTKGLKFSADIMPGLPTGHGDARRLSQVLLNLVGNAVKFTDTGEVAIGAAAEDGHFVLTVRDTGPGVAPEDQDKIFGEFQQVDNSNTRKKGGTGLGLAISKRMVEMQGGTISVESELGQGATFRVVLPIRVEGAADELSGELMGAAQ